MGNLRVSFSKAGRFGGLALVLGALAACGGNDKPLTGTRYAVGAADVATVTNQAAAIRLPNAVSNAEWTHINGSASHSFGHAALSQSPSLRWSTDIGQGVSRNARITSGPITANGLIYTLDGASRITAVGTDGSVVWSLDTTPTGENELDGAGGGLSYTNGILYAGTGFGELLSINAATGGIQWRRGFEAGIRSAPTSDGRNVFVITRADVAYAVSAKDGGLEWLKRGRASIKGGLEGGASPAISGSQVVLPFASGDVISVRTTSGDVRWSSALDGARQASVLAFVSDITGDPVIDGNSVYAANIAGQTVKLNMSNGTRSWSLATGATDAVWPVGGSVFLMSDKAQLMRVNAGNGDVIWSQQLPQYDNPEKRKGVIRQYGPVLAGGLMWVAGRDGQLRGFEPEGGQLVSSVNMPGGAAAAPIVAGGVMYILSLRGELHAFQ